MPLSRNAKHPHRKNGVLVVTAEEETSAGASNFNIQLSARHVDKKDLFGKSDPYIVISKESAGLKSVVYKTEVIKNTLDPSWRVLSFPLFSPACSSVSSSPPPRFLDDLAVFLPSVCSTSAFQGLTSVPTTSRRSSPSSASTGMPTAVTISLGALKPPPRSSRLRRSSPS